MHEAESEFPLVLVGGVQGFITRLGLEVPGGANSVLLEYAEILPGAVGDRNLLLMDAPPIVRATSFKPSNIRFNIRKLMLWICSGAAVGWCVPMLTGVQVLSAVLAGIAAAHSLLEVEITGVDAVVLWSLWRTRDNQGWSHEDSIGGDIGGMSGVSLPGPGDIDAALARLERLGCIEADNIHQSRWRVAEEVFVSY